MKVWRVEVLERESSVLEEFLNDGWEPFSATSVLEKDDELFHWVYLRKQFDSEEAAEARMR